MRSKPAALLLTSLCLITAQNPNQTYSGAYPNLYSSVSLQAASSGKCSFSISPSLQPFIRNVTDPNRVCIWSVLNCVQARFNISCTGRGQRGIWLNFTDVTFPGVMRQLDPADPIAEASFRVCQLRRKSAFCRVGIGRTDQPLRLTVKVAFAFETRPNGSCDDFRGLLRSELKNCVNAGFRVFARLISWIGVVLTALLK